MTPQPSSSKRSTSSTSNHAHAATTPPPNHAFVFAFLVVIPEGDPLLHLFSSCCTCFAFAVILSASFEREEPRESPERHNSSNLSPQNFAVALCKLSRTTSTVRRCTQSEEPRIGRRALYRYTNRSRHLCNYLGFQRLYRTLSHPLAE